MKPLSLFLVVLALAGCAKKAPPGPASVAPGALAPHGAPFHAQDLGLDVVSPSSRDPHLPSTERYQGGIAALKPAFEDSEMILLNTLSLGTTDPGPFIVWPEQAGERKISEVTFTVRAQGVDNRLTGQPRSESANLDRDTRRFYIPIAQALSRRLEDLGPADQQILSLRVHFTDGESADVTVRFHVVGPLSALRVVRDESLSPPIHGSTFFDRGSVFPIRRMTFWNPTARSVSLWIRSTKEDLVFTGRFHYPHHQEHGGGLYNWGARLQMGPITDNQRGSSRKISYRGAGGSLGAWSVVHFDGGEEITLEWTAVSQGCLGADRNEISGVTADGTWQMETWLTERSRPATPGEFPSLPSTLALAMSPVGQVAHIRTGDWDGFVGSSRVCSYP